MMLSSKTIQSITLEISKLPANSGPWKLDSVEYPIGSIIQRALKENIEVLIKNSQSGLTAQLLIDGNDDVYFKPRI